MKFILYNKLPGAYGIGSTVNHIMSLKNSIYVYIPGIHLVNSRSFFYVFKSAFVKSSLPKSYTNIYVAYNLSTLDICK